VIIVLCELCEVPKSLPRIPPEVDPPPEYGVIVAEGGTEGAATNGIDEDSGPVALPIAAWEEGTTPAKDGDIGIRDGSSEDAVASFWVVVIFVMLHRFCLLPQNRI
jgi:hypothetical protein